MSEFFHMGGYGAYVWSSYALTLLVLAANAVAAFGRERSVERSIAGRLRRDRGAPRR